MKVLPSDREAPASLAAGKEGREGANHWLSPHLNLLEAGRGHGFPAVKGDPDLEVDIVDELTVGNLERDYLLPSLCRCLDRMIVDHGPGLGIAFAQVNDNVSCVKQRVTSAVHPHSWLHVEEQEVWLDVHKQRVLPECHARQPHLLPQILQSLLDRFLLVGCSLQQGVLLLPVQVLPVEVGIVQAQLEVDLSRDREAADVCK
mmetsp:Transcript_21753/g.71957  ORF Transcript_21753/g.71957 Transcript_21753/m.71957 type:complete len:202 (-) Transcript_21753:537-1142(-)